jgi:hypothetical protein
MAAKRQYATAGAFRTALEARLNERAGRDGVYLKNRLRRQADVLPGQPRGADIPELQGLFAKTVLAVTATDHQKD